MLFKCEYCLKRYWTKKGHDACVSKHHKVSRMVGAQYGQGFDTMPSFRQHTMPLESYKVQGEAPTQSSGLGFTDGMLAALALNDLLEATENFGDRDEPKQAETPKLEPAPADVTSEPKEDFYRSSSVPVQSSDDSFSSLGSSSLGSSSLSSDSGWSSSDSGWGSSDSGSSWSD